MKLFNPNALQSTINVLSIESWLEETINRKKRRCEEVTPSKDLIIQLTSSQPSKKTSKEKIIVALAIDSTTGHMLVEVVKP